MFKGALALLLRQILLIIGGSLVAAGLITEANADLFCFSPKILADATATGIFLLIGGGGSIATSFLWRLVVKAKDGVT